MRAAAESEEGLVYVDLLDDHKLRAITVAMRQALQDNWSQIWPSTIGQMELLRKKGSQIDKNQAKARPMLVPLDRLGAQQGFSGASVFIGYFVDITGTYLPSRPVVVKVGNRNKLQQELNNAASWPPHYSGDDTQFAFPFLLSASDSKRSRTAVLVGPFSAEGALNSRQTGWRLRLNDLWQVLSREGTPPRQALRHIRNIYDLMHGVHREGRVECGRVTFTYHEQYRPYLRGIQDPHDNVCTVLFGNEDQVSMFGERWPNPRRVIAKVLDRDSFEGACGPVHGDLHPKNVVFDKLMRPSIIDFGWAERTGHVIRDYVLMELNLRALTFPVHVNLNTIIAFSAYLSPTDPLPNIDGVAALRLRLIKEGIWRSAVQGRIVRSWDDEYIIPMFMMAFGLLRHLENARNQIALVSCVLSLALRVNRMLDKDNFNP